MPYRSKAQARWAHATGQPWAGEWDEATKRVKKGKKKGFKALPDRVEKSAFGVVHKAVALPMPATVTVKPLSSLKLVARARKLKDIRRFKKLPHYKSAMPFDVTKRQTVPDWASGMLPASTVRAYDYSNKHKKEAATHNFAVRAGGAAAGSAAGLGLAALAIKTKKVPKWILRDTVIRTGKGKTATIASGEKKRYVGGLASGAVGGVVGGVAGQQHLKRVQRSPRYEYGRKS